MLAIGAQTPVLALLALRRPRVLVAVVAPYLVLVPVAVAIGGLAPTLALGALLLAAAPAELAAPALARAVGGRAETAAAVMTGTLVVSFALLLAAGTLAAAVGTAVLGGDVVASVLGGGTRDFAVAATLAADLAPSAAALPLVYGALLFGLLGLLAAARALRSRSARRNGA